MVTLTGTRTGNVTVVYATADGTAAAGDDYTTTSGNLTFGTSETTKTIRVPTLEDSDVEEDETFRVTLSSPAGATIADGSATGTITDDDGDDDDGGTTATLPTLSIADAATVEEGETAEFTVTLTGTPTGSVTVAYATSDVTADAGDDYTTTSGTLTFGTNETTKTIRVPTLEDSDVEEDETFTATLSSPAGATIADGSATGTISDDNRSDDGGGTTSTLPTLSIADATVEEGAVAEFTVTLTGTRTGLVTVAYSTADGTAAASDDYTSTSGTLTFETIETTKTITVATLNDSDDEADETFTVTLSSPAWATIEDGEATGTITDDDAVDTTSTLPTLSIADATVEEGAVAEFTVSLSGARTGRVTVAYSSADGTANAGDDYASTSGSLSFETNETSKTITVATLDDSDEEEAETFTVTLSRPAGATIEGGEATGTITDDDRTTTIPLPALSIADATVEEGEEAEFAVTLSGAGTGLVTVAYSTADGTADAGDATTPARRQP